MYRYRSQGNINAFTSRWQTGFPLSCANRVTYYTVPVGDNTAAPIGEKRVFIDNVTPDFWKRSKQGAIILNGMYASKLTRKSSGTTNASHSTVTPYCTAPNVSQTFTYGGTYFIALFDYYAEHVGNTPIDLGDDIHRLYDEIWTRCMADRQKGLANLSESLAELDKTISMLLHPFNGISQLTRDLRRNGKRKKGFEKVSAGSKDFISFVSSEWLRYRYGITPLVSDVKAVMKALKKQYSALQPKVVSSHATGNMQKTSQVTGYFLASPYRVDYGISRAHQVSVRATHIDKYKPDVFDDLGLTFHNVVGLAWELTHYSFVVDWFANVGDLMYANIPRASLTSQGGVVSTRRIVTTFYYPLSTTNIAPAVWTISGSFGDNYLMVDETKERFVRGDNYTALVIKSDFRSDNFNRVADAFAIANQLLRSIGF